MAAPAELEAALRAAVAGQVRFDAYTRHLYSRDASMYAIEPSGVVFPRDGDDVAAAVSVAATFGVSVLARGAGTSLAGQAVGPGIVLDLSRHMHEIVAVDPEARMARVQPGVVQEKLNRAAAAHGLAFGPDTSTANRATIGGMIGNNSAGSHSVRYGMTIDHVHELEVVLADASRATFGPAHADQAAALAAAPTLQGALYRELPRLLARHEDAIATGFPRWWRQSGGYRLDWLAGLAGPGRDGRPGAGPSGEPGLNLAKLVTGSEGTLAIVTEATVGLVPAPRHQVIAVGHFGSVQAAIEATEPALACEPAAVELLDRTILDLARSKIEYRALASFLQGDPEALLFVTFFGDTQAEAVAGLDRLDRAWGSGGAGSYFMLRAVEPDAKAAVVKVRQSGLGLLMAASVAARRPLAFIEDTAVDPARLAEYTRRLKEVLDSRGLTAGFYGHASVGCLHVRPVVDLTQPGQAEVMRSVADDVRVLVAEFGGVNSSEHGDGLARSEFNERVFGTALYQAMCEVKQLFDVSGRLNPGKITGAGPMTEHLRDAGRPAVVPLVTRLAFASGAHRGAPSTDMYLAADRCMNIGLCRKSRTGVMCPSYMATGEEEHSTRGRAGALVKALAAADPKAAFGEDRLHEILDLCLGCKACKSECPLGVDIAALKAEALAAWQDRNGIGLRARLLGRVRTLNRLGSATAPLANALAGIGPARRAGERLLGLAAARPLPRFERASVHRWMSRRRTSTARPNPHGTVVFLADCFTSYTDTAVARAAIESLELAGWRVILHGTGCCGRAAFSAGRLDLARRQATRLAERLAGPVAAGRPVTGAEPSCLLTLRDEYPALLPDASGVAALAAAVTPAEELLVAAVSNGRLALSDTAPVAGRRIVFHGHCHQKAITGTAATVALLRAIPGADVAELDAGCCGMAGSFGFEAEHYDLSMRIGGSRLFPAVQGEPDAIIAATGVSCRQQIRHGTGRHAQHPLEIVREAVGGR